MKINWSLGQINVTTVFDKTTPSLLPTEDIKSVIYTEYGNEAKIALSQFPDLAAMIVAQEQVSIIAENKRLQIINTGNGELTSRAIDKFARLVVRANQALINKNFLLKAYGFNYSQILELTSTSDDAGKLLVKKFLKSPTSFNTKLDVTLSSTSPSIAFKSDNVRYDLRFEPIFNEDLSSSNKITLGCNIHIVQANLPDGATLQRNIDNYLSKIKGYTSILLGAAIV